MSFKPKSPGTYDISGPPVEKKLDRMHISRMEILLRPGAAAETQVRVIWTEGFTDVDGTYCIVKHNDAVLDGEDLANKLSGATSGKSLYDEVKAAMWSLLQGRELVGAGTVG